MMYGMHTNLIYVSFLLLFLLLMMLLLLLLLLSSAMCSEFHSADWELGNSVFIPFGEITRQLSRRCKAQ